jgi:hypothetical protein
VAVSAAGFWLAAGGVRDGRSGRSRYLGTALLCCVGLWTKTSTLPGLFVLALAVFLTDRRPSADRLKDVALAVGLLLAVAGPYLIWNIATYGDPLGVGAMWQVAKPFEGPERFGGAWSYLTGSYWTWTLESYWACFGWMQLFAPQPLYAVFALIVAIGVAGFVLSWLPRRRTTTDGTGSSRAEALPWPAHLRSYLVASIALTFAAHIWINVHEIMWQGRHLFVAAPQFGCLLACGHARWSSGDSARSTTSGTFGMMALMGALALYCLIAVVIPAYPETS